MDYQQYEQAAKARHEEGLRHVQDSPAPEGQKFPVGARVRIADDLGPSMSHFPKGRLATVKYTHAHAFGGDDVASYCLDVDGCGSTSWYKEHQLTLVIDEWPEYIGDQATAPSA
jgi:hypothetical protein